MKKSWLWGFAFGVAFAAAVAVVAFVVLRPHPEAQPPSPAEESSAVKPSSSEAAEKEGAPAEVDPEAGFSPELSSDKTVPADAPEDTSCESGAPQPYLDKAVYKTYHFARFSGHRAEERVQLAQGNVTLTIKRSGCVDAVGYTLFLEIPGAKVDGDDGFALAEHWTNVAISQLERVKFKDERDFETWRKFLAGIADLDKTPAGAWQRSLCKNGSNPGPDGCPADSGGLNRFRVESRGQGVLLSIVDESTL